MALVRTHTRHLMTRKQFSGSMLEFGSQVMLKLTDKVSGGVMQERRVEGTRLESRVTTLEHLVARKSDGVVVRTRAVRDFQKSPTVEDLDRIIGHPLHKVFNVTARTCLDLKPQNQKSIAPLQDPMRVVLFHECTSPEVCWKSMVIPRDANDATP